MPSDRSLAVRLVPVSCVCAIAAAVLQIVVLATAVPRMPVAAIFVPWLVAIALVAGAAPVALARRLRRPSGDGDPNALREGGVRPPPSLPGRFGAAVLLAGGGAIGVATVTALGRHVPTDAVVAAAACAAGCVLAWSVLAGAAVSVAAPPAASVLARDPRAAAGGLQRRIVREGVALLAAAVLVYAALAYASVRAAGAKGWSDPPPLRVDALVFLGCAVVVAFALLLWIAARSATAPLPHLERTARALAAGDLTARAPLGSGDELGRLAVQLGALAESMAPLVAEARATSDAARDAIVEVGRTGARLGEAAREQLALVASAGAATAAIDAAADRFTHGAGDVSEHVHATSAAVGTMAAALEEVRRQSAELDRHMTAAVSDVGALSQASRAARAQLGSLGVLAGQAGATFESLNASVSSLEASASANQLAATHAAEMAERAGAVVQETVRGVESVRSVVGDARSRVTALGRRSDDIDKILDFIAEVAGRTNLLSLNASIIATQAGEHGKAFAVVAEQIRELAAQISSSTKSIGQIIQALRTDVSGTARLIERGDELATEGVAHAQRSVAALHEIRGAAAAGRDAAGTILGAVQSHSVSARDVSELARSFATSSQSLSDAIHLVGTSADALGSAADGVRALADGLGRALEEQSGIGRRQVEGLELLDATLAALSRAVEEHRGAAARLRGALAGIERSVEHHDGAARELAGTAARIGVHSGALADRVARFKIQ